MNQNEMVELHRGSTLNSWGLQTSNMNDVVERLDFISTRLMGYFPTLRRDNIICYDLFPEWGSCQNSKTNLLSEVQQIGCRRVSY